MEEFVKTWGPMLLAAAAFAWNVRLHFSGARKDELAKLDGRIAKVADDLAQEKTDGQQSRQQVAVRLGQFEAKLDQVPNRDSVHQLALQLAEIAGDVKAQGATLTAVAHTTSRWDEFMIANSGHSK